MKSRNLSSVVSTSAVLFVIWLFLTLDLHPHELILGLAAGVIIAVATGGAFTGNLFQLLLPRRFFAFLNYTFYFLKQMFLANLDVLFRVIKPVVPVRPGIVRAAISLSSERARNIVANSITLTPGTLTVEMTAGFIFVHWISLPEGDIHLETQKMVDGFADRLEKVFE
jgi:multicomponent Na+:H+ antiporter subunit E